MPRREASQRENQKKKIRVPLESRRGEGRRKKNVRGYQ